MKDTILLASIPHVDSGVPAVVRMQQPTTLNADQTVSFAIKIVQPNDSFCSKQWSIPRYLEPQTIAWMVVEVGAYNISGHTFIAGKGSLGRKSWSTTATFANGNLVPLWFPTGCGSTTDVCVLPSANRGAISLIQSNVNIKETGKTLYLTVRAKMIDMRRGQWVLVPHDVAVGVFSYHVLSDEILGYLAFPTGVTVSCLEKIVWETSALQINYVESLVVYSSMYDYPPGVFGMVGTITSLCHTVLRSSKWQRSNATFGINEDQCVTAETRHTTYETVYLFVIGEVQSSSSTFQCSVEAYPSTSSPLPALNPI